MSESSMSTEPSHKGDVLILSKWHAGAVNPLASLLRGRGWRSVLLTAENPDRNEDVCDAVVRVDWDGDVADVTRAIDEAGVAPAAIVNLMDVLMGWQVTLAQHFGVRGPAAEYADLVDKAAVRKLLAAGGFSQLRFLACEAGETPSWTTYPAVVKPALQSGGSAFVTVVHDDSERAAAAAEIAGAYGVHAPILIEEHISGSEFSVDVVVQDGRLTPVMVVEKLDVGAEHTRDGGLLVTPPESPRVHAAADELVGTLEGLVKTLGLRRAWLHVEARAGAEGPEIIEINPRCGGGAYLLAVKRRLGMDPLDYQIDLYLPDGPPTLTAVDELDPPRLGFVPLDTREAGNVRLGFDRDDLLGMPNVVDALVFPHFVSSGPERENIFAEALIGGDDLPSLRETERRIRAATPHHVEPIVPAEPS